MLEKFKYKYIFIYSKFKYKHINIFLFKISHVIQNYRFKTRKQRR